MKRLAIDAGHGLLQANPRRFDPGALGGGRRESDITMDFARALAAACLSAKIPYMLTREGDDDEAPLSSRVQRARDGGADVFVSLHCNAFTSAQANGTETLYRISLDFARRMHEAAVDSLNLRDRGIKPAPRLAVLRFPGPCALVELGFITNDGDRSVLLHPRTHARFATAVIETLTTDDWL